MAASTASKSGSEPAGVRVREYLASLPPDARSHLRTIRELIRAVAPGAEEVFSYGIPGFRLDGKPLVWYAAWKRHSSIYPIGPALTRAHGIDIGEYEISKGTIRFPLTSPLPAPLLKRLVKARIAEVRGKRTR